MNADVESGFDGVRKVCPWGPVDYSGSKGRYCSSTKIVSHPLPSGACLEVGKRCLTVFLRFKALPGVVEHHFEEPRGLDRQPRCNRCQVASRLSFRAERRPGQGRLLLVDTYSNCPHQSDKGTAGPWWCCPISASLGLAFVPDSEL